MPEHVQCKNFPSRADTMGCLQETNRNLQSLWLEDWQEVEQILYTSDLDTTLSDTNTMTTARVSKIHSIL